jgi:hypothetical protein
VYIYMCLLHRVSLTNGLMRLMHHNMAATLNIIWEGHTLGKAMISQTNRPTCISQAISISPGPPTNHSPPRTVGHTNFSTACSILAITCPSTHCPPREERRTYAPAQARQAPQPPPNLSPDLITISQNEPLADLSTPLSCIPQCHNLCIAPVSSLQCSTVPVTPRASLLADSTLRQVRHRREASKPACAMPQATWGCLHPRQLIRHSVKLPRA